MKNLLLVNTTKTYGIVAVLFHWIFAILILGLFASGFYMVGLTYYHPWYHPLPEWHVFFGITCLLIMPFRIAWHFFISQPHLETDSQIERKVAPLVHGALLILSTLVLISGYLITSVDKHEIEWLAFALPAFDIGISQQASLSGQWHKYLAYTMMGLTSLHILAALKHSIWDKKKIFRKILWPFKVDSSD